MYILLSSKLPYKQRAVALSQSNYATLSYDTPRLAILSYRNSWHEFKWTNKGRTRRAKHNFMSKKYGGLGIVTYDDAMPKTGHAVQRAGARGQGGSSQNIAQHLYI